MEVMQNGEFEAQLAQLETAEEFLTFFGIEHDKTLVMTKHIPLLRMYQRILSTFAEPRDYNAYKKALCVAYKQIMNGHELAMEGGCLSCSTGCDQQDSDDYF